MLTMYGFIIFPIGSSRLLYYLIESSNVIQIVIVNVFGVPRNFVQMCFAVQWIGSVMGGFYLNKVVTVLWLMLAGKTIVVKTVVLYDTQWFHSFLFHYLMYILLFSLLKLPYPFLLPLLHGCLRFSNFLALDPAS